MLSLGYFLYLSVLHIVKQQDTMTSKKDKATHIRSTSTIDLGRDRKERIANYRAKMQLEGTPVENIDAAVRQLIDLGLQVAKV